MPSLIKSSDLFAFGPNDSSEEVKTSSDYLKDIFRSAAKVVDGELEALDHLNHVKAVREIAELFDINAQELWYFIEYGEEEAERLFNLGRKDAEDKSV